MAWKIKVDAVAVPRAALEYEDENGNTKYHHVSTVYVKDEVVPDELVSPVIKQLYDDGDESVTSVYEKVSDDHYVDKPPFDDYDKLTPFEIRARMQTMTSEQIEGVKAYERDNQNREGIVDYVTGYGESPTDRNKGELVGQSGTNTEPSKLSAKDVITPKRTKVSNKTEPETKTTPKAKEKAQPKTQAKRTRVKKQSTSEE